ncbi:kinase-like protein [Laetiporus sulphureus 93-53]|uniref:Kinase-like protein n=1 Tax=Laetiporus sulphureus 93-53 TaxID=1314785 RepID=A0A165EBM6_9APHY|nr:kinase-like protein [Laetiporus sulphureus 93-53]KZT06678.1 kinase-like protein [Laetiporus sulphureus 93-53]
MAYSGVCLVSSFLNSDPFDLVCSGPLSAYLKHQDGPQEPVRRQLALPRYPLLLLQVPNQGNHRKDEFSTGILCGTPIPSGTYRRRDDWLIPSEDVPKEELKKIFNTHEVTKIHAVLVFDEDGVLAYCHAEPIKANVASTTAGSPTLCGTPSPKEKALIAALPRPPSFGPRRKQSASGHRILSATDFDVLKFLGKGGFGTVSLVRDAVTNRQYALKVVRKERLRPRSLGAIFEEQEVLKRLRGNAWFSNLQASFHDTHHLYIVLDFCAKGGLHSLVAQQVTLSRAQILHYTAELIHALEILHGDIKSDNIFIDADNHIVLGDFDLARDFTRRKEARPWRLLELLGRTHMTTYPMDDEDRYYKLDFGECDLTGRSGGTGGYMAPDLFCDKLHSFGVDIWAAGVTIYKLFTGRFPFDLCQNDSSRGMVKKMLNNPLESGVVLGPDAVVSENTKDLLRGMLEPSPHMRWSAAKIKKHAFFQSIDWARAERRENLQMVPAGLAYEADEDPYPWFEYVSPELHPARRRKSSSGLSIMVAQVAQGMSGVLEKGRRWWTSLGK